MTRHFLSALIVLVTVLLSGADRLNAQVDHDHSGASSQCHTIDGDSGCTIEDYLLSLLASQGVGPAMAALDSLAAQNDGVRRDGHGYAHAIGITAFTGEEEV